MWSPGVAFKLCGEPEQASRDTDTALLVCFPVSGIVHCRAVDPMAGLRNPPKVSCQRHREGPNFLQNLRIPIHRHLLCGPSHVSLLRQSQRAVYPRGILTLQKSRIADAQGQDQSLGNDRHNAGDGLLITCGNWLLVTNPRWRRTIVIEERDQRLLTAKMMLSCVEHTLTK